MLLDVDYSAPMRGTASFRAQQLRRLVPILEAMVRESRIRGFALRRVEGCGHMVNGEASGVLVEEILALAS